MINRISNYQSILKSFKKRILVGAFYNNYTNQIIKYNLNTTFYKHKRQDDIVNTL